MDSISIDPLTKAQWAARAAAAKKEAAEKAIKECAVYQTKLVKCEADLKAEKASCGAHKKAVAEGLTQLRAVLAARQE